MNVKISSNYRGWGKSVRIILITFIVTFFLSVVILIGLLKYSTLRTERQAEMLREYYTKNPVFK